MRRYTIVGALAVIVAATGIWLSTTANADQSPTWITLANVPAGNGIAGTFPAAIGGKIYVPGGGWDIAYVGGGAYKTFLAYDIATNQWSNLPSLPYNIGSGPVSAVSSVIYLFGGGTNEPCCSDTYKLFSYDINLGSWASQPMPFDSRDGCSGVINGKVYVTGPIDGRANTFPNLFYAFDPANNSWTRLASPSRAREFGVCGVINNKFYLTGGTGPSGFSAPFNSLESYDPGSNLWTPLAPMPIALGNAGNNAVGFADRLYVFGGTTNDGDGGEIPQVQIYNPQSNSWSSPYNIPYSPTLFQIGVVSVGSGIYLVGGQDGPGTTHPNFSELVPPAVTYTAQVQQPINVDGSSVFNASRGELPVIFTLTIDGVRTCNLPAATISLTRTSGALTGAVAESVYRVPSDIGSAFRISDCQWIYNLNAKALGAGTYQIGLSGTGVTGTATFALK